MKRIAVIGGGIAGIAAALELSKASDRCRLLLVESSHRLGGVLETVRDGPYLIEKSADNFATLLPAALELTGEFGSPENLIRPESENRQAFVLHAGKLHPIPMGFSLMQPTRIASVLATRVLSWRGKLRLLREYFIPKRVSAEDESLQSFATRRLGREAFENLVEPIVSGIFTANPATLSMQATMPQFVEMERKHGSLIRAHFASKKTDAGSAAKRASGARYDQFMAPREGMSQWIDELTQCLPKEDLHLSTLVQGIRSFQEGWILDTDRGELHCGGVIIAAPARVAAPWLPTIAPEAADIVGQIEYASSAVVAMVLPTSELTGRIDGFGMIVPTKEGRATMAISYTSNKYPGRVPNGQILLRLFFGGALRPDTMELSDSQLCKLAYTELRDLLGWTGSKAIWQSVIRWPSAMPQYTLGHCVRMERLERIMQQYPGVELCGAAYQGVGIPQCVRSGREAAKRVLLDLARLPVT